MKTEHICEVCGGHRLGSGVLQYAVDVSVVDWLRLQSATVIVVCECIFICMAIHPVAETKKDVHKICRLCAMMVQMLAIVIDFLDNKEEMKRVFAFRRAP